MKKKLFFLNALMAFFGSSLIAQTITPVTDTVHYYYQKQYFKRGTSTGNLPYYKAPARTSISFMGSKFENKDTLVVHGLETYAARTLRGATNGAFTMGMYLCELDNDNMPKLPPLDSVILSGTAGVGSTVIAGYAGNFPNGRTRVLTKDFAVLVRNMSDKSGDTILFARTACRTYTAWSATNGPGWEDKFSDGYGYVRFGGKFQSATNSTVAGFGYSTDYEFIVAPRVSYNLKADHILPPKVVNSETLCTFEPVTFTNTSSWHYTNRMYNFLEFTRKWNDAVTPFHYGLVPTDGWTGDSAITWFFRDQDNGKSTPDPRAFLPFQAKSQTVTHYSDSTGCFEDCSFIARHRKMRIGSSPQIAAIGTFSMCVDFCNGDGVGVKTNNWNEKIKMYPNPTSTGKTKITGLIGNTNVEVFDILGQLVHIEQSDKESLALDLSNQSNGTYFVHLTNSNSKTKVVKVIKQD